LDKFKKHIMREGRLVGVGSSRFAVLWKSKIWKIPFAPQGGLQTKNEQKTFESLNEKDREFFPEPIFYGRIISMNYVNTAASLFDGSDEPVEDLRALVGPEEYLRFLKFLNRIEDCGIDTGEIIYNGDNVGLRKGQIRLTDWGMPSDGLIINDKNMDYLENLKKEFYEINNSNYRKLMKMLVRGY